MITALERSTPGHAACTTGVIPSHIPRRLNCKHRQRHTGIALSLAFFDWHQEYTKREPFPAPIIFVYPRAVRAAFQGTCPKTSREPAQWAAAGTATDLD